MFRSEALVVLIGRVLFFRLHFWVQCFRFSTSGLAADCAQKQDHFTGMDVKVTSCHFVL